METGVIVTEEQVESYRQELLKRERSQGTVAQYVHAVRHLAAYLHQRPLCANQISCEVGVVFCAFKAKNKNFPSPCRIFFLLPIQYPRGKDPL